GAAARTVATPSEARPRARGSSIARCATFGECQELRGGDPAVAIGRRFHTRPGAATSDEAHDLTRANERSPVHAEGGIRNQRAGVPNHRELASADARL